jgi:hypothetical protein
LIEQAEDEHWGRGKIYRLHLSLAVQVLHELALAVIGSYHFFSSNFSMARVLQQPADGFGVPGLSL